MSSTWASVVPTGVEGTQGLPPPFRRPLCPSSRVGFAPISTKSGESRASVWILRSGPSELVDQGQHIEVSAGVVAIVGAASRAGRERLRGSSPPDSTTSRIQGVFVETQPVRDEAFRG